MSLQSEGGRVFRPALAQKTKSIRLFPENDSDSLGLGPALGPGLTALS